MAIDEPLPTKTPFPDKTIALRRRAETARLGNAIAELAARIQAATYELLVMVREFDEREGWGGGFKSCAHWLNWRTGLAMGGSAREGPRGPSPARPASPERRDAERRPLLLEGSGPHSHCNARERIQVARLRSLRDGGPR